MQIMKFIPLDSTCVQGEDGQAAPEQEEAEGPRRSENIYPGRPDNASLQDADDGEEDGERRLRVLPQWQDPLSPEEGY